MASSYLICKWLHIVAVISWMAGILYLLRLFIYHREYGEKSQQNHELLSLMEQRLYNYITVPAMIATWGFGLAMISINPSLMSGQGWLHAKIALVFLLTGVTHMGKRIMLRFSSKESINSLYSTRTLRVLNEVPTVLMIVIVALVIFRPF